MAYVFKRVGRDGLYFQRFDAFLTARRELTVELANAWFRSRRWSSMAKAHKSRYRGKFPLNPISYHVRWPFMGQGYAAAVLVLYNIL